MNDRSPLPPLLYQVPRCPICRITVNTDGALFWCGQCKGRWSSAAYDQFGVANPDVEQCPAEVAPYDEDEHLVSLRGYRYRCVRDEGHELDGLIERHIGARSDNLLDFDGEPFEWDDSEYPQWTELVGNRGTS